MIFLTVGTQFAFDRLTASLDAWCGASGRTETVFGQIGQLEPQNYRPQNFEWMEMVDPEVFDKHLRAASLIVSHAGMGSIISALSEGTPIIILPRRAALGEHRSEHQVETAIRFGNRPGVFAIMSETELPDTIDRVLSEVSDGNREMLPPYADQQLIEALSGFIHASNTKK